MRRLAIATLVAVVLVPASRALAFGSYADALPNGRALFDALGDQSVTTCGGKVDGGPRCLLCHETATGGQNAAYHCGNCSA